MWGIAARARYAAARTFGGAGTAKRIDSSRLMVTCGWSQALRTVQLLNSAALSPSGSVGSRWTPAKSRVLALISGRFSTRLTRPGAALSHVPPSPRLGDVGDLPEFFD